MAIGNDIYGDCLSQFSCLTYPTITKANPVDLGQLPLSIDEHKSLSVVLLLLAVRSLYCC